MTTKRKHPFGLPEDRFTADRREAVLPMARPHAHNQIEMNYFLSGRACYIYNGQAIDVCAGDFVFFWGAIPHRVSGCEADTRFSCLYIPLERFMFSPVSAELKAATLRGGFIRVDEGLELDRALFEQTRLELLGKKTQLSEINYGHIELRLRRADVTGWTDVLSSAPPLRSTLSKGHRKVVEMTRFISENAERTIAVADVAAAVSLHPKYAMFLFRTSLGMTITQYLMRLRVITAQRLLLTRDRSAAAIAYESGFGSISRFYEAFHQQVGVSPRQFRDLYALKPQATGDAGR